MKSIEYVKRYGSQITSGNIDAAIEMANSLLREANSEWDYCRKKTEKLKTEILEKYNRKGNTIADLFKREYRQDVLKKDWFRSCVLIRQMH